MKRIAVLLCVLALLLAACSRPSGQETTQAVRTEPAGTAAPTDRPAQPTAETPTEPPVTEAPEPESSEPEPAETGWRAEGSRTDGGVLVWTDPSAYRPYGGFGAKYTRLREGPLDQFEPSDDYGAVYPYVAEWMNRNSYDMDSYEDPAIYAYGFVDRSGRVLTDGVYRDVKPLSGRYGELSTPITYWVVCITDGVETAVFDMGDGETMSWTDPVFRYGLISADGSYLLDCVYREIFDTGGGILCSRSSTDFDVFDYDMELLFTGADVLEGLGCDYAELEYGEGMFLVRCERREPTDEENIDFRTNTCWFCDAAGKRVLGPYRSASPFREGLACVSVDGANYGYIDQTGAWAIEPIYSDAWQDFENGRAIQKNAQGQTVVIDRTGAELFRMRGDSGWVRPCGYVSDQRIAYQYRSTYYDREGNFLIAEADADVDIECLDETTFYSYEYSEPTCTLRLLTPEQTLLTADVAADFYDNGIHGRAEELTKGALLRDGTLLLGWYGAQTPDRSERIFIPEDCSEVITFREPTPPAACFDKIFLSVDDLITGETWYFCWTGTAWEGRNEAGDRWSVPLRAVSLRPAGNVLYAYSEDADLLLNRDGEILFRCPIDTED